MLSRSKLPGTLKQSQIIRALVKLGWVRRRKGGKGSHIKLTWPKTNKSLIVQRRTDKDVIYYLLKEIEKYSGHTWENIRKYL